MTVDNASEGCVQTGHFQAHQQHCVDLSLFGLHFAEWVETPRVVGFKPPDQKVGDISDCNA
jgi:hypothetical protein